MSDVRSITAALATGTVYDLGQPLSKEGPYHPNYPPFTMALQYRHGDWHAPCGMTFASELIVMTGHTGTHVDALGHCVSANDARGVSADHAGLHGGSVDELPPLLTRGLLIDAAGAAGVDCLPDDAAVTAEDMQHICDEQGIEPDVGDAVLIRTGWIETMLHDPGYYDGEPGIDVEAGRWLAEQGVAVIGCDNFAVEHIPFPKDTVFPVHQLLIRGYGIPLLEGLVLAPLAATGASEFLFVAGPLPFVGGTGSPLLPIAIL